MRARCLVLALLIACSSNASSGPDAAMPDASAPITPDSSPLTSDDAAHSSADAMSPSDATSPNDATSSSDAPTTSGDAAPATDAMVSLDAPATIDATASFDAAPPTDAANQAPVIAAFGAAANPIVRSGATTLTVTATDPDGDALTYDFSLDGAGALGTPTANTVAYTAGADFGGASITVTVSDPSGATAEATLAMHVGVWSPVGPVGFSGGVAQALSFAIDGADNMYVGYRSFDDDPKRGYVRRFDSSSATWPILGGGPISTGTTTFVRVKMSGSVPYVVYENNDDFRIRARRWTGALWQLIPGIDPNGFFPAFTIGNNGRLLLAFRRLQTSGGPKAAVQQSTGGSWSYVPNLANGGAISPGDMLDLDIIEDGQGRPLIVFDDASNNRRATAMRLSGGVWSQLGQPLSTGSTSWVNVTRGGSGIYATYVDGAIMGPIAVHKLDPATDQWQLVGPRNFTGAWVSEPMIADDGARPYVAFADDGVGGVSVMFYDAASSAWKYVGQPGFGTWATYGPDPQLAFDSLGRPHVAYYDSTSGGVTVVRAD